MILWLFRREIIIIIIIGKKKRVCDWSTIYYYFYWNSIKVLLQIERVRSQRLARNEAVFRFFFKSNICTSLTSSLLSLSFSLSFLFGRKKCPMYINMYILCANNCCQRSNSFMRKLGEQPHKALHSSKSKSPANVIHSSLSSKYVNR